MSRILPIILIVLSACLGYFYIYPTWSGDVATLQQQINSYNQSLAAADTFNSEQKELLSKSKAISPSDEQKLEEYMPNTVDNIQLILDLNALANQYGITLSGFSIQDNDATTDGSSDGSTNSSAATSSPSSAPTFSSSGSTNSLDLTVTATGTYGAFIAFLSAVELSERPLDVMSIMLTNSNTGIYTYTMTFRIYWLAS